MIIKKASNNIFLSLWLLILTIMVYLIILVGGLTRLTESGLSMVDWRPILGIIPPISQEDWFYVFNQYKKTPEFIITNSDMQLNEFKYIFWWEYAHRLLARLIGFVFIIPFIYFLFKKRLSKKLVIQLIFIFIFILFQALVGWWMVKSGLENDPYVSQYRLSFHLLNAIVILTCLYWITMNQIVIKKYLINLKLPRKLIFILLILCLITIISGSFVSATDAGKSFNTFPLMNGQFFPEGYLIYENIFLNFFENTIAIQFNHRLLAIFTFFFTVIVAVYIFFDKRINSVQKSLCIIIIFLVTIQVILGILTLIYNVPIFISSLHQANATLLYCSLLTILYLFSNKSR